MKCTAAVPRMAHSVHDEHRRGRASKTSHASGTATPIARHTRDTQTQRETEREIQTDRQTDKRDRQIRETDR